ncbi:MAG: peptidoglycan-N-acetylglucosamine deacetylase [Clostridium butyricum]|nr:peptidoglycan-N-acetylglucosamine deacetylase [Clostridium butyricum]
MNKRKIIILGIAFIIMFTIGLIMYMNYVGSGKAKENGDIYNENNYQKSNDKINVLDTDKKAQVIRNVTTSAKILSISFEGIDDSDTMTNVLELLDKYKVKATFIVSGIDSAENPDILNQIKDEGHEIGNASLNYKINVDDKSKEELIYDFSKSNKIIEDIINDKVNILKCKSETYSDELLEAAYACGNEYVLDSDSYLNYQSFKNYEEAYGYVNRLKNGSILSIKLNGVLDETEYTNKTNNEKPAIDKESGIKEKDIEEKHQVTTFEMIEWLLRAISQNKKAVVKVTDLANIVPDNNSIFNSYTSTLNYNYRDINTNKSNHNGIVEDKNNSNNAGNNEITDEKAEKPNSKYEVDLNSVDFKNLIDINDKRVVDINSEIYTTKNSVTYTFKGLSNENTLDYVLESLKQINGHGTFFVTKDEIEKYPERVNKIIEYGNEIGNGGVTNNTKLLSKSTEDIAKEIYEVGIMLKNRGIKTNAYMPGYDM